MSCNTIIRFAAACAFLFLSMEVNAQNTDLTDIAGETTSIQGGQTNAVILGFNVSKNSGSPTLTGVKVTFSTSISGIFTNLRLFKSSDAAFGGDTQLGTLTLDAGNTYTVSFASETIPSGSTLNFYVVADVDPNASTGTINASIAAGQLTIGSGSATGSATGPTYDNGNGTLNRLTTVIAGLNGGGNNIATSPLVALSASEAVFGFSLESNGTQTVDELTIGLTSDPANKLATWSLVKSVDSDYGTTGDNTTLGGLTFTPSATNVVITGLNEDVTNLSNYFLVASVHTSVTNATSSIQPSLTSGNVSVTDGYVTSNTITGTSFTFAALQAAITGLNSTATNGVASSPLGSGASGVAVFGFSLESNGTQVLEELRIGLTSDPSAKLGSFSLVRSIDNDFASAGDNTTIGGLTITPSATQVQITGLSENLSTIKHYFLVANVDASVSGATPAIQASLTPSGVTTDEGSATSSATGLSYNFITLSASLNLLTNGVATSPLRAGTTGQAILGFSVTSTGTQSVTGLTILLSSDPTGKLNTYSLVRSTDNSFSTSGDNTTIGGLTITPSATQLVITGLNESVTGTRNYFLVANIVNSVTSSTPGIQLSFSDANVTISPGTKATQTITGTAYAFDVSNASDIILNGGTTANINYENFDSPGTLTTGNSASLVTLQLRDGGGTTDGDDKPTILNEITLQFGNHANLRKVGLFDGTTFLQDQDVTGPTVTFTGLSLTANEGGTNSFTVRASFNTTVTDNQYIQVSVVGAVAASSGSSKFNAPDAGNAATSATTNLVDVDATKLEFVATPPNTQTNTNISLSVRAVDDNGNIDIDRNGTVTLSENGVGAFTGDSQTTPNLSGGQFTWSTLKITLAGSYTITAAYSMITSAQVSVTITSAGVAITPGTLSGVTNLCYNGDPQPLTNITIAETDPSDFGTGSNLSLTLILADDFVFGTTTTPTVSFTGSDVTFQSAEYLFSGTVVRIFYTAAVASSSSTNSMIISGLSVKYTGTSNGVSGTIKRLGGSAVQAGNADTDNKTLASFSTQNSTTDIDFTVEALAGDPNVDPNKTNFSVSERTVKLVGSVPNAGVFTGNGVSLNSPNGYVFTPSAAGQGVHPVSYTVQETTGQKCFVTESKNFNISSATVIQSLATSYCKNSPPSAAMFVTTAQRNFDFPPQPNTTVTVYDFQYINTITVVTIPWIFGNLTFYLPNYVSNPGNTFDPTNPAYDTPLNDPNLGYISMTYRVRQIVTDPVTSAVLSDQILMSPSFQIVQVYDLTPVDFSIPKTSFCLDEAPVDLTGDPSYTTITSNDYFTAVFASNNASSTAAAFNAGSQTWRFDPSNAGVTNTPVQINITYTAKDLSTGCSNTSAPKTVTVNPRPGQVPSGNISPGTTMEICQNTLVPSFLTPANPNITYNWYADALAQTRLSTGNSYQPSATSAVAATTNYYITQTIAGCESPARQLSFVVNPVPGAPGTDFENEYCQNAIIPNNEFTIPGTNVRWYNFLPTVVYNGNNPTAADLSIQTTTPQKYGWRVTQTSNKGCESSAITVVVVINPLPELNITSPSDLSKICEGGDVIKLSANQGGGQWSGEASAYLINTNIAAGTTTFNPNGLTPDSYTLEYTYTEPATQCENTTTADLIVLPTINPDLQFADACKGFFIDIVNNSTIFPASATATIDSITWSFGDQSSLPRADADAVIPDGFSPITRGTFFSPSHLYRNVGKFEITATMKTSDGCQVIEKKSIDVREVPIADFRYANICFDPVSATANVSFTALEKNPDLPAAAIADYAWTFNKAGTISVVTSGSGETPTVTYGGIGRDSVRLILTSIHSCKDTIQKPIFIVPSYPAITETNSYFEDFNSGSGGWVAGGINSSWEHGVPSPAMRVINKDSSAAIGGQAWVTNLDGNSNAQEQSWVLSQCFDFSQAQKPVLSFDIISDTPILTDGAVLQYTTDANIEPNTNWTVLGVKDQGINWYDITGIASNPGQQQTLFTGWSGDDSNPKYRHWSRAVFKLDELIGEPNVKFRIAFASNFGSKEGFAFDNVFIGERSRTVLIENFVNTSSTASDGYISAYNNIGNASSELVKVQYHTSFPGNDPLYMGNRSMNDSRTAFYGITSSPSLRIDGQTRAGNINTWAVDFYNNRVLQPAMIRIDTVYTLKDGDVVRIKPVITNIGVTALTLDQVHLFTVVVEKSITEDSWMGNSNHSEFQYVAKDFLPSPAGLRLSGTLLPGESMELSEVVWKKPMLIDETQGAIVMYVQSLNLQQQREVFQSRLFGSFGTPAVVSGLEGNLERISLYPNPSNELLHVVLPAKAEREVGVKMIDSFGRTVYQNGIKRGEQTTTVSTEQFAGGVYFIQLETAKGVLRKKIMIVHD
jgi:hypothetical protein